MVGGASAAPRRRFVLPLPPGPFPGRPAELVLGGRTLVQGIVNATPDSFSDGGRHATAAQAVEHALRLVDEGADWLDVGGESTRPGAEEVPADEQRRRVLPVIEALARRVPGVPLSVDTRSAAVARDAVAAGAAIVNDVSGLAHDPEMRGTVASLGVPAIVMHMRGTPADMATRTAYADPVADVVRELTELLREARAAGVRSVLADPGIGFAKTPEQSLRLLAATDVLAAAAAAEGAALLVGPSRKRFLDLVLPPLRPGEVPDVAVRRLPATIAAVALAAARGAAVVRVHDVAAACAAVRLADTR